ncbi:MAG TPA: hypothetical protein VH913_19215, partial [Hyphomicrobiaceae bacterium]
MQLIGDLAVESSRCQHLERQASAPLRVAPVTSFCFCVFLSDQLSNGPPTPVKADIGRWGSGGTDATPERGARGEVRLSDLVVFRPALGL